MTACTVGPDYTPPDPGSLPVTGSYSVTEATPWWQDFNDPTLSALILNAAEANPTVHQALAAVAGARAQIAEARAGGMPQLNASLGATAGRNYSPPGYLGTGYASTGFDASWEIDLWGKQRRTVEAADANAEAAKASADAAALTLRAEVARTYIALRAAQALQLQLLSEEQTAKEQVRVASTRQAIGDGSGLETLQAQILLSAIQSRIPVVQATIDKQIHALADLCGTFVLQTDLTYRGTQPTAPLPEHAGVPADLLRRRPDVRQAERQLAQATAGIGVAEAERLPTLSLSGSVGLSGNVLSTMLAAPIFALGPSVKLPIFDGGARSARVEQARSRTEVALWTYRETVSKAVKDVEDSLSDLASATGQRAPLSRQVASAQRAIKVAVTAFLIGAVDFTTIASIQLALNQANEAVLAVKADEATDLVALYKAIGGGYEAGNSR